MTLFRLGLLVLLLAATTVSAGAQAPQPGDWFFGTETAVEICVPEAITRSPVFDGASRRPIGQLFGGALYVRAARRNGFAVINAYSHTSAESASYATFEYDGRHYLMTATVEMRGRALEQLTANLTKVPKGPPVRSAR